MRAVVSKWSPNERGAEHCRVTGDAGSARTSLARSSGISPNQEDARAAGGSAVCAAGDMRDRITPAAQPGKAACERSHDE